MFPSTLTKEEEEVAVKELWEHRKKLLQNRSKEEKVYSNLLRLKYEIEDWLTQVHDRTSFDVIYFLNEYMNSIGIKQKELAADIAIHTTRLSRILNRRERLSLSLAYRLERHSGGLIPALLWWKLVQKEIEREIQGESQHRADEMGKVKNVAFAGAV